MTLVKLIEMLRLRLGREPAVGFVGCGASTRALLDALPLRRAVIRDKSEPDRNALPGGDCRIISGEGYLSGIDEDLLLLSPSVRRDCPELIAAERDGCILSSDAELFFDGCDSKVYAVSGSDGKSTASAMAALMLSYGHPEVELLGNGGTPFARHCGGKMIVAELSSFQLSYLAPLCEAALLTTLTPNHLNWHASLSEYISAKLNLFKKSKRKIYSPDTELLREACQTVYADAVYSVKQSARELAGCRSEHYIYLDGGYICRDGERLLAISECGRREAHNIHNLMGAVALVADACGTEDIRRAARSFQGLEHRLERISARGVDFINSSIDTTPARMGASITALDRPIRLILGGLGKGLSIKEYIPLLEKYAERIAFYGDAGREYAAEIGEAGGCANIPCACFKGFADAVDYATEGASEGDAVLLSPAATGYGEFKSFKERGEAFISYAEKYRTNKDRKD